MIKLFFSTHPIIEYKKNSHESNNLVCALAWFIFCPHNYTLSPNLETHKNIRSYHAKSTYNQKTKSDYLRFHMQIV